MGWGGGVEETCLAKGTLLLPVIGCPQVLGGQLWAEETLRSVGQEHNWA